MTVAVTHALTDALLVALRAAWTYVGDGEAPDPLPPNDNAGRPTVPYAVLYPAGLGPTEGPVSNRNADARPLYQLTCVGGTRQQAEWLSDKLRPVLLTPPSVSGWNVAEPVVETSQPVRRDDSTAPPLLYTADQVRFFITPA
jgi:hypothetical protein